MHVMFGFSVVAISDFEIDREWYEELSLSLSSWEDSSGSDEIFVAN